MATCKSKAAVIVLLALGLSGCKDTASGPGQVAPPKVTVGRPIERTLHDEDEYNGWLQASESVDVRARVRGHIKKIYFQDGDMVEHDQLLFELDPQPFQVAIDETIAQAQAFEAQKVAADKEVLRQKDLEQKGATAKRDVERAIANADAFDAQIAAKMQEVERHKLDLKYSKITAPIAGRIGRAMLTEGNLVNAGGSDPLLTTIVAIDPIYIYFPINERALQRYRKERKADSRTVLRDRKIPFRFGLDSDKEYLHEGVLDFAENRIDSTTGTIEVRGVVDNKDALFTSGSRVRLRLPAGDSYSATLVPDAAILSDQDKRYVLVVGDKNVVSRRDVELGKLLDDGMRVVLPAGKEGKGVTPEERIVVLGLQRARINYPVEPVEPSGKPTDGKVSVR